MDFIYSLEAWLQEWFLIPMEIFLATGYAVGAGEVFYELGLTNGFTETLSWVLFSWLARWS